MFINNYGIKEIIFTETSKPKNFNQSYFNDEALANDYLKNLANDILIAWNKVSDKELVGLFVAGSNINSGFNSTYATRK